MSVTTDVSIESETSHFSKKLVGQWIVVLGLIYLLLVAVSTISGGFKSATGDNARQLFEFARNPVTGLVIGTIATALIQSSSTVTSIIVGLVAGGLPVGLAIPMVMGANIGTTITNTIVSLGHVREREEFKRAYAAATIHDFFNLLCVVLLLPLELMTGFLSRSGYALASMMSGSGSLSIKEFNVVKPIIQPALYFFQDIVLAGMPKVATGVFMILIGVIMIFVVITLLGKLLKSLMVGKAKEILHKSVGRGPFSGLLSGILLTVLVQSSSTTTSLIVPLAGNGVFSLRQVYPFTLGANIGTCITALLAATAITGGNAVLALQIAFVHLLYNMTGVIIIYGIPFLRNLPLYAAEHLAESTVKNKLYALAYIFGVFFLIPGVLIALSNWLGL
ncbi:MAG: Na/Pi symporter [Prosthecochloris sp.]|uniref:Na+/Picotransporter n=1 Tax=Prosthecochloris aestuarii (strain DSM 271 / SK 413) TaxID=290512 RepID=B4S9F5_PROA2|nr:MULTISPECIES: Na/Pi symporter [Prosthecochloris]ACF46625.1 Na+/Picotransporter [Prosthecochloris aestuarii DSM 271]MCW8798308.1 Na/Pi symporter [Prosthecochloris sp.]RDD29832.1 Na/Pi cotransporter family protein [Prosthecochloris sp. ZM]